MIVLCILYFLYMPLLGYVNTRLEGIAGNIIQIPLIHQAALILSGYRGVAVWFLPVPVMTFSKMALLYRQCELTGTKFTSLWKAQFFLKSTPPVILYVESGYVYAVMYFYRFVSPPTALYKCFLSSIRITNNHIIEEIGPDSEETAEKRGEEICGQDVVQLPDYWLASKLSCQTAVEVGFDRVCMNERYFLSF